MTMPTTDADKHNASDDNVVKCKMYTMQLLQQPNAHISQFAIAH